MSTKEERLDRSTELAEKWGQLLSEANYSHAPATRKRVTGPTACPDCEGVGQISADEWCRWCGGTGYDPASSRTSTRSIHP